MVQQKVESCVGSEIELKFQDLSPGLLLFYHLLVFYERGDCIRMSGSIQQQQVS